MKGGVEVMNRDIYIYLGSVFTFCLLVWAAPGQSASHTLDVKELPAGLVADCQQQAPESATAPCSSAAAFASRRLGNTPAGELFLVSHTECVQGDHCKAWLVEKTAAGVESLLTIPGRFELHDQDGPYPSVMTRSEISEANVVYQQYQWGDTRYQNTENRVVYRVDGVECGTAPQCKHAAEEALQANRQDEAVKIDHAELFRC